MATKLASITGRIVRRSAATRKAYVERLDAAAATGRVRNALGCSNLAHGFAACDAAAKRRLIDGEARNVGIVTAYNDMLSAHQPYARFPEIIKRAAKEAGATAQVAGATPAMCDGVTQGQLGMELSLFSRDVIAQATAIGLAHAMYDAALILGICDKIVPGQLIGALSFGHLPMLFVPGGPMRSGLPNHKKARVRQDFAAGKATRIELLNAESASYHSPGTCTFYGTANSNQMFMEIMGLHVPASTFVNPDDPRRDLLTAAATRRVLEVGDDPAYAIGRIIDEKAIVNAICGLLATGGSTNHTIHLVAIARAGGIVIDWQDFEDLSNIVPLLTRVYPNGTADVNHFRDAGGLACVIDQLCAAGLLHDDVMTMYGPGLAANYLREPRLGDDSTLELVSIKPQITDSAIISTTEKPFSASGGIRLLTGNLGRSIVKVSAIPEANLVVEAPAVVVSSQRELLEMLAAGLDRDLVAVVRHQGVMANGMPELHKLTPGLAVLQGRGRKVALVTDGRMSGASGAVPAAIHLSPEAAAGGPLARLVDDDPLRLDCIAGTLDVLIDAKELAARQPAAAGAAASEGCGRELFALMRDQASTPEQGGTVFALPATPADTPVEA